MRARQAGGHEGRTGDRPAAPLLASAGLALAALTGCPQQEILITGEFGRPVALASGDASPLPRLTFKTGECPGAEGGCTSFCAGPPATCPADACMPLLVDSGSPITVLPTDGLAATERACFEARVGGLLLGGVPDPTALASALTRFRFDSAPALRLPGDAAEVRWGWQVGDAGAAPFVGGVLGGNVLREMAVRFTAARGGLGPQVTFYREFPGTESILAAQGSAAIPLQFPGLLLGKLLDDVCAAPDGENCDFASPGVFDREHPESLLQATRMVVDACLGPPPAAVIMDPTSSTRCALASGPGRDPKAYRAPTGAFAAQVANACTVTKEQSIAPDLNHGHDVSLVVATGVPGLVLFADSARRMFGDLDGLAKCQGDGGILVGDPLGVPACLVGQAGVLRAVGWPPAGLDVPLYELRVRSVGLVPGLTQSTGSSPCQRLEARLRALRSQCDRTRETRVPRDVVARCREQAADAAAVVGQAFVAQGAGLSADLWIPTLVVPEDHPLAIGLRRDTSPEALQPDGILGTALLAGTDVVLDYTDPTPSVRVSCVDPDDGTCLAMPACVPGEDPSAVVSACCFGLPEDLLVDLIRDDGAYGCCAALSPATVDELNTSAVTEGREPPCPSRT